MTGILLDSSTESKYTVGWLLATVTSLVSSSLVLGIIEAHGCFVIHHLSNY